jgi:Flp pilus assembly protein TadD
MRPAHHPELQTSLPAPGSLADDEIEAVYGHAYSLAQAGAAAEAAAVLARLAAAAPYSDRVWQALGAVLARLGEVRSAAAALALATLLRGDDEPPPATLAIIEAAAAAGGPQ